MTSSASVDQQMQVLMRGTEFGDSHIRQTMDEELRARLAEGRPLRVYCGFDPTAVDLHLGHLVPMLKMRQFQQLGHDVTFLIGTMTGIVGDPTDRAAARQKLTLEQVEENAETWLSQAFRVLEPEKTTVKRNGSWLGQLGMADIIELGSHFTVAQFLEREGFRQRLESGRPIYLHEFFYALMQAYDALELQTDVQIGGVDQLFNILGGRELQRDLDKRPLIAITMPILIGTDGKLKMSKSVGNYVGLDDAPADIFGKVMSIPDSLLINWFTLLTDVPEEELRDLGKGLEERRLNPMEAKKRLAREIVAMLRGQEAAQQAQQEFERVFQRREEPEEAQELAVEVGPEGTASVDITQLLSQSGVVQSRGEARRLLSQGAIAVDGNVLQGHQAELQAGTLIRVGRHRFLRVVSGR